MLHKVSYYYRFTPEFSDIDAYNYAHHSKYLIWFENARIFYLVHSLKLSADLIMKYKFPVTSLSCKFYNPISFGEKYKMKVTIELDDCMSILKFSYRIMDQYENKTFAKAMTNHILVHEDFTICDVMPKELLDKFIKEDACNS